LTGEINSKLPFAPVSSFVLDFIWLVVAGVQITAETFVLDNLIFFCKVGSFGESVIGQTFLGG